MVLLLWIGKWMLINYVIQVTEKGTAEKMIRKWIGFVMTPHRGMVEARSIPLPLTSPG